MNIEGATALVTGGNRGIGLAFVREFLAQGAARVYIGARTLADAEALLGEDPERLRAIELDVTRSEQVERAAANCQDVSILVNNAGAFVNVTLMRAPDMSAMREEMEVNCFGMIAMCRAFAPILARNGGGAIANVLSVGGIVASPIMGGYSPSKFAARAASTCIRAELADQGTTVSALIVGSVDTRMAAHVTGTKATPQEVAREGVFAIRMGIDEWDTDPMAINARAKIALDPKAMEKMMARRLKMSEINTRTATAIYGTGD